MVPVRFFESFPLFSSVPLLLCTTWGLSLPSQRLALVGYRTLVVFVLPAMLRVIICYQLLILSSMYAQLHVLVIHPFIS